MTNTKQHGFTMVATLVALVAVLAIAGTGYLVVHGQKDTVTITAAKTTDPKPQATPTPAPQATPATTTPKVDEATAIKAAVLAYHKSQDVGTDFTVITIAHRNDSYALGDAEDGNGGAGDQWFAQKSNGTWTVLSEGVDGHCDELAARGLTSWDDTCTN